MDRNAREEWVLSSFALGLNVWGFWLHSVNACGLWFKRLVPTLRMKISEKDWVKHSVRFGQRTNLNEIIQFEVIKWNDSLLCKKTSKTSLLNWQTTNYIVTNQVNNQGLKNNTINWRDYNSFWLWRWRLHRSLKRRSLSTTVLFRITLTWTIMLQLQYEMIPMTKILWKV